MFLQNIKRNRQILINVSYSKTSKARRAIKSQKGRKMGSPKGKP